MTTASHSTNLGNLRRRILGPLTMGLAVLLAAFVLVVHWNERRTIDDESKRSLQIAKDLLDQRLREESHLMHAEIGSLVRGRDLAAAFQDQDRPRLLQLAEGPFQGLRESLGIGYLSFLDPQRKCFLRADDPTRHGDVIRRHTVVEGVRLRAVLSGLELDETRGALTFRVVSPWYQGESLIGFIEIGEDVDHVLEDVGELLKQEIVTVIHKDRLNREGWEANMRSRVGHSWDRFPGHVVVHSSFGTLPEELQGVLSAYGPLAVSGFLDVRTDGRRYRAGIIPLYDAQRDLIGRLFVLRDVTDQLANADSAGLLAAGIGLSLGAALCILFYLYLGRVEQHLTAAKLRKRAERQLRDARDTALQASKAKSEFLANMSHEIRTPLNGIIGMAELALRDTLTAAQRERLELVNESASSLLDLINDILDFSKVEAGKLDLEIAAFSVRRVVESTVRPLEIRAQAKGLGFEAVVDPDVPRAVLGDSARLKQILTNLVANAIKFTQEGRVEVRVRAVSQKDGEVNVQFTVTDTGIGIPKEKQKEIFKAFSQADTSVTRKYGGTGLGLSISQRLATLMGGSLWVESDPGHGSRFRFTIPLKITDPAAIAEETEPANELEAPILRGLTVLVVDDDPTSRQILGAVLADLGLRPVETESGEDALARLLSAAGAGSPFGIALIDRAMPGWDGIELARQVRRRPSVAETPIVLVYSDATPGDAALLAELGIAVRLKKPIHRPELHEGILSALDDASRRGQKADELLAHATPARGTGADSREARARQTAPREARGLSILLAEDNDINQVVAVQILEELGHRVTVCGDGRAALAEWEKGAFDLVLMDVQMPKMGGLEAISEIRKRERGRGARTPILSVTAHAMKGDRERCLAAGADGYVSKPIHRGKLIEAIGAVVPRSAPTATHAKPPVALAPAPVSAARGPAARGPGGFDRDAALAILDGKEELLLSIGTRLREGWSGRMAELRSAAAEAESEGLAKLAHALKGAVSYLADEGLVEAVRELERTAKDGLTDDFAAAVDLVEGEWERVRPGIDEFCRERKKAA